MEKFSSASFVALLKRKRADMGLSQKAMADFLGMKQPMYARYESGTSLPSIEILFNICSRLGLSADELLGLKSPPPSVHAVRSSVAVGTGAVAGTGNCATCPLMKAAAKMIGK